MFSRIILKILRSKNLKDLAGHTNSKVGPHFRMGDFCTVSINNSAQFISGNSVNIRNYCNFFVGEKARLILHDRVFMNNYCSLNALEHIEIGENTLLGEGVKLYDHNHEYGNDTHNNFIVEHQKFKTAPIKIGKNCWLGSNVIVLKGVTIGDNCVIGAGTVLYKDVPENTVIKMKQNHIM